MILVTSLSLLAAAVAWISWSNIRSKLAYDLHKIRGSPAWPLIGNLNEVLGSSYLHKVLNHLSGGGIETCARIRLEISLQFDRIHNQHVPAFLSTWSPTQFQHFTRFIRSVCAPVRRPDHLQLTMVLHFQTRFAISRSTLSTSATCTRSDHYLHPLLASHGVIGCICHADTGKLE